MNYNAWLRVHRELVQKQSICSRTSASSSFIDIYFIIFLSSTLPAPWPATFADTVTRACRYNAHPYTPPGLQCLEYFANQGARLQCLEPVCNRMLLQVWKTLGMYEHEEARMVWLTWLLIDRDTVVLGTIIAYAPSTMWLIYMALPISNLVSFPPTG